MPDWADIQAGLIWSLVHDNGAEELVSKVSKRIAHDLRKAKADGYLAAAKIADSLDGPVAYHIAARIRAAAVATVPPDPP